MSTQTVEPGDLFRDNDPRHEGRIVRVVGHIPNGPNPYGEKVTVETVEHWDETRIGRRTRVMLGRLVFGKTRMTGYTKVSH